jgi:hypothetical protein
MFVCAFLLVCATGLFYATELPDRLASRSRRLETEHLENNQRSVLLTYAGSGSVVEANAMRFLTPVPTVTPPGGLFVGTQRVAIEAPEGATVRYTTDGSIPGACSPVAPTELNLSEITVLRLRSFHPGRLPSVTSTCTYLTSGASLPSLSLAVDPSNLHNPVTGFLAKPFLGLRAYASVEYFVRGKTGAQLSLMAQVQPHGGFSRFGEKKSLRLRVPRTARSGLDLGGVLTAPVTDEFRVVVLRCGGNNYRWRLIDELFCQTFADVSDSVESLRMPRPVSRAEPYHQFINGAYWGIYNMRDRYDADFLRRQVGPGDYDIVKWEDYTTAVSVVSGDTVAFDRMQNFFESTDLTSDSQLARAGQLLELGEFTDYVLLNIYAINRDWPNRNVIAFKPRNSDTPFRYLTCDADQSFGLAEPAFNKGDYLMGWSHNMLSKLLKFDGARYSNRWGQATRMIRALMRNTAYRDGFVRRLCDLLNTTLLPQRIKSRLQALVAKVDPDVHLDLARWGISRTQYVEVLDAVRAFAEHRPAVVRRHFQDYFKLGDPAQFEVDVEPEAAGKVQVNTVVPSVYPWRGQYFRGTEVELVAAPKDGWVFAGWEVTKPHADSDLEASGRMTSVTGGAAHAKTMQVTGPIKVQARFVRR